MRPLRLRLTAFGPFATTQTIDFTKVYDARLFGIYGATGAGKTSVLDGLCFALFGESSGSERQSEDLRSHHASPDDLTQTELVFEVSSRCFHIVRRPRQTVRALRGPKLTERAHWAALYDVTGIPLDEITPEAPGVVIEERKVDAVAEQVRAILNYTSAQFRQVVLLPQGQFRALLTATSDQRSAVLRGLFDVSLYERVVDRLKAETSELQKEVQQGRADRAAQLSALALETADALREAIAETSTKRDSAEVARDRAIDARTKARSALATAQLVEVKFEEYGEAERALAELQTNTTGIDQIRLRLAAAERAQLCQPLEVLAQKSTLELARVQKVLQKAQQDAAEAGDIKAEAAKRLVASMAEQAERDNASAAVTRLEEIKRRVDNAEPLRDVARKAADALDTARRAFLKASQAHERAEEAIRMTAAALEEAQDREVAKFRYEAQRDAQARELADAEGFATVEIQVAAFEAAARSASEKATSNAERLARARTVEQESERALGTAQAIHLAQSLEAGRPCPVCGSKDHPAPAGGEASADGLEVEWRRAREAREEIERAERNTASKAIAAEATWRQAASALADRPTPSRSAAAIAEELQDARERLSFLATCESLETAKGARVQAETALQTAASGLGVARTAQEAAEHAVGDATGALRGALADLPEGLDQPDAVAADIAKAIANRDRKQLAHRKAVDAEREASDRHTAKIMAVESAATRERELRQESDELRAEAQVAIRAANFDDTSYERAKPDIGQIKAFEQTISSHEKRIAAASERKARAVHAIASLERPNLERLREALAEGDLAHDVAERDLTTTSLNLKRLQDAAVSIAALEAKLGRNEERYRIVGELANLGDGRNLLGIRLRDFAIAATFDLVLDAANLRFTRMSRGRFALARKLDRGDARTRAGLDIEVFDAHTDQTRDAHTLSGGEGFLAALSLALGLSDVVQAEAGGVKLDVIFIDEGFGHLDDETLDLALDTLRNLVGLDRAVGIISHVETVKQQVTLGFDIVKTARGSAVLLRPRL
jgi:exonuclease SbcC